MIMTKIWSPKKNIYYFLKYFKKINNNINLIALNKI